MPTCCPTADRPTTDLPGEDFPCSGVEEDLHLAVVAVVEEALRGLPGPPGGRHLGGTMKQGYSRLS